MLPVTAHGSSPLPGTGYRVRATGRTHGYIVTPVTHPFSKPFLMPYNPSRPRCRRRRRRAPPHWLCRQRWGLRLDLGDVPVIEPCRSCHGESLLAPRRYGTPIARRRQPALKQVRQGVGRRRCGRFIWLLVSREMAGILGSIAGERIRLPRRNLRREPLLLLLLLLLRAVVRGMHSCWRCACWAWYGCVRERGC